MCGVSDLEKKWHQKHIHICLLPFMRLLKPRYRHYFSGLCENSNIRLYVTISSCQKNLFIFVCLELISSGKVCWEVETKMSWQVLYGNKKLVFLWTLLSLGTWQVSAKLSSFNPPIMEHYSPRSSGFSGQN